ncbi:ATP-binding cassette domain-containing protein [Clostridium tyrobutyricum]|jgi:taurine transport system ATP-binding protein|uniref:ABC-type quaternary amine transporter n=1 Tax=Clostridium tyrobutyricum DIVETGP TaxID=1408889 RepID=W6N3G3_CLOTY|nr:ABC transporter ATP-binding protein [Clostridium tyrobutyricum]AND84869.1 taurine transport system ATP-binding protein [Clostridium tyrobutyricum]ANP69447.1 ABC transporter ATP-binding protein [Clostridium tyrobutyricum]MBR9647746.1 ABC transporter ATP-binding protein [Clostridium tyrobutyricum]MBV4416045.1 ABC transporter ATP-binding protein [Clostridium tyrobutyricum]MBV4420462.1 ABC transporter ATP-binding protein [Clostridium tyrobutyricum]
MKTSKKNKYIISLKNVDLTYKSNNTKVDAINDINIDIKEGEFICILGPSGCGKSTLMKIMAGFMNPSRGKALVDGNKINGADHDRGVVFQQPALYPWLSVEDNVKFGLRMRRIPKKEAEQRINFFLDRIGLDEFRKLKPYELSGGMKQRVAIARVLVNDPKVLLMDEPFGALDALTREQMQNLLRHIWNENKKTVLFITHDIDEALYLGTKVIVMSKRPGRIIKEFNIKFTNYENTKNLSDIKYSEEFKNLHNDILDLITGR